MNTQEQWAYVAGLVDGEGSFSLTRSGNSYTLHIDIYTTSKELFDWLGKTFSFGQTYLPKRHKQNPKHKDQLRWHVPASFQKFFTESVLPYLVIKRSQAELALEFRKMLPTSRAISKLTNEGRKLTPEQIAIRQSFKDRLTQLNRRGP
jgi:hypothetical protein